MKAALIHNPLGGGNRRSGAQVPALARAAGLPVWSITHPAELEPVLPEIARADPDLLIVNGGDGTVDAVVTALRHATCFTREPMLALLAGGTTNMIARDVGLTGRPDRALRRVLTALAAGQPGEQIRRAPLVLRRASGADLFGFFLGGGALPLLLRKVHSRVHHRGFISRGGEAVALLQTVWRLLLGDVRRDPVLQPRRLHWTADARAEEQSAMVLYFITTLDRLVLGLNPARPAPGVRMMVLRHPYHRLVRSVARLLRGRPFADVGGDFIYREGRTLRLNFEGELVLDGEPVPLDAGPIEVGLELGAPLVFWRI